MTSQASFDADTASPSSRSGRSRGRKSGSAADGSDAGAGLSDVVQQVSAGAKEQATTLISEAQTQIRDAIDAQVEAGIAVVAKVAESVNVAADHLEPEAPHVASLFRAGSERLEDIAEGLRGQSAEDLLRTGSDFIRREPGLAFGAAAAAGFLLVRLLKSGSRGARAALAGNFELGDDRMGAAGSRTDTQAQP